MASPYIWTSPVCADAFERLVNCPVPIALFEVNGAPADELKQRVVTTTWKEVWSLVAAKHWHTRHDDKGRVAETCPHAESLADHLRTCAELCYTAAVTQTLAHPLKYFYTGLLHDLGKPGTFFVRNKHTSFKGHGLMGGALIQALWDPAVGTATGLSAEDWGDISATADVHMCGYFPDMCQAVHLDTFALLRPAVRDLLCVLRLADIRALTPHPAERAAHEDDVKRVEETHPRFVQGIQREVTAAEYCTAHAIDAGVLILLQGVSGSGKSTLRASLEAAFAAANVPTVAVVRDDVMVATVQQWRNQPVGGGPDEYRDCHAYYTANKKQLAPFVNTTMQTMIQEGLLQGAVVLVDTLATMYSGPATAILPEYECRRSFRAALWTFRGPVLFTPEESQRRHGMSEDTQVTVHGRRDSVLRPLAELPDWAGRTSFTESKQRDKTWDRRPHLSLTSGWGGLKQRDVAFLVSTCVSIVRHLETLQRPLVLGMTRDLSLDKLVNDLYKTGGIDEVTRFFQRYKYTVSRPFKTAKHPLSDRVVGIKYIDGVNRHWRSAWAREARGRFYLLRPDHDTALPLKNTLQRGIELLTAAHTKAEIGETQDVRRGDDSHLDDVQRWLLAQVNSETPVPLSGVLTCKVDGSLLLVNVYRPQSEQHAVMHDLLGTRRDVFTITLSDGSFVVPATQGTLFLFPDMAECLVTVLAAQFGQPTPSGGLQEVWAGLRAEFATWIEAELLRTLGTRAAPSDAMYNFAFEMVCANRTRYTGRVQTELAVSYPTSFLALLGVYITSMAGVSAYVPHFDLTLGGCKVVVPGHRAVTSSADILRIMTDLSAVVQYGTLTLEEFSRTHFGRPDVALHAEGFVYLQILPNGQYDYSKIKLPLYYQLHKLRRNTVKTLMTLPPVADAHFPTLVRLRAFVQRLPEMLTGFMGDVEQTLKTYVWVADAPWIAGLPPRARARVLRFLSGDASSDEDQRIAYKIALRDAFSVVERQVLQAATTHLGLPDAAQKAADVQELLLDLVEKLPVDQPNATADAVRALVNTNDSVIATAWSLLVATPP